MGRRRRRTRRDPIPADPSAELRRHHPVRGGDPARNIGRVHRTRRRAGSELSLDPTRHPLRPVMWRALSRTPAHRPHSWTMRILVFGNSGSGKTTLARALAAAHGLAHLDLDSVVWEPGQIAVQRPADAIA